MDQLGENLVHVLDALDVKCCIGIGEGAGADILCRFAVNKMDLNFIMSIFHRWLGKIAFWALCSFIVWPLIRESSKHSKKL